MKGLRGAADVTDKGSLSNQIRSRRFSIFERLIGPIARPVRVLDVGGTTLFWEQRGWAGREDIQIVLVNLEAEEKQHANIDPRRGDATSMPEYGAGTFDVVFSNSVIEHLFTLEHQRKMASEVARIGKAFWVQTPNFWFPIEPHFHLPGWQWMPQSARVALLRRRRCGWRGPEPDAERARALVREVRLMRRRELVEAFPGADVWGERFKGLVKSWVVTKGFQERLV